MGKRDPVAEQAIENTFTLPDREVLPGVVNRRHSICRLTVQDVVPGALRDGGYLCDQRRGDAEFRKALAQEFDHGIEMRVIQTAGDQMLVAAPHIRSAVVVRAAERHRQKRLLFRCLAVHIDTIEKRADPLIGKNLPVEDIDRCVNSGLAAQLRIKGCFVCCENGFHKLCIYHA